MKKVFVPTRSGADWQPLLAKPKLHWKVGASAMTAAAAWEGAAGVLPPEITRLLESSRDKLLLLIFSKYMTPFRLNSSTPDRPATSSGRSVSFCHLLRKAQ